MRTLLVSVLALSLSACAATGSGGSSDGWITLFDGTSTDAWRGFGKDALPEGWVIEGDTLTRVGPGGDIITRETFEDFELELEWRVAEGGNSGIFFHVAEGPGAVWETGPEMQVLDNALHRDGGDPSTSAGANYALHAPVDDVTRPVGEFNHVRLVVVGGHVEHWLNGVKLLEYQLGSEDWERRVAASKFASMPRYGREGAGHLALQDHGDRVWYRAIRVRRR
jgi:hypothetical protein